MTRFAARQARHALYLVFLHQRTPESQLICRRIVDRFEDVFAPPHVALGVLVTVDAPAHIKRVLFPGYGHLSHLAMARRAPDTLLYVDTVIKVGEVGQGVDPRPLQGLVRLVACPDGFEHLTVGPDLGVAGHACRRRREARE